MPHSVGSAQSTSVKTFSVTSSCVVFNEMLVLLQRPKDTSKKKRKAVDARSVCITDGDVLKQKRLRKKKRNWRKRKGNEKEKRKRKPRNWKLKEKKAEREEKRRAKALQVGGNKKAKER